MYIIIICTIISGGQFLSEEGKMVLGFKKDVEELKEKIEAFENEVTKLLSSTTVETTKLFRGLAEEAKNKVEQFIEEFRSSSWDVSKEVIGKIAGINEKTGLIFEELDDKLSRIFSKSLTESTSALKELISSVETDTQSTSTEVGVKMNEALNEAGKSIDESFSSLLSGVSSQIAEKITDYQSAVSQLSKRVQKSLESVTETGIFTFDTSVESIEKTFTTVLEQLRSIEESIEKAKNELLEKINNSKVVINEEINKTQGEVEEIMNLHASKVESDFKTLEESIKSEIEKTSSTVKTSLSSHLEGASRDFETKMTSLTADIRSKIDNVAAKVSSYLTSSKGEVSELIRSRAEEYKAVTSGVSNDIKIALDKAINSAEQQKETLASSIGEVVNRGLEEIEKTFETVKSEVKGKISPLKGIAERFSEVTDLFVLPDEKIVEKYMIDSIGRAKSSIFAVIPANMGSVLKTFTKVKPKVSVQIVTNEVSDLVSQLMKADNIKLKILPELDYIGVSRDREEVVFASIKEEVRGIASTISSYIELFTRFLRDSWLKAKFPS